MFDLIKLEFKKYKLQRYILAAIICIVAIMASMTNDFVKDSNRAIDTGNTMLRNLRMSIMIVTITFIIFSAVLTAKIMISEYKNKTILVMFTYPISRRKIIISKMFIVVGFTMISILIGDLVCSSYMIILNSFTHVIYGEFVFENFMIVVLFISIIVGGILSLLPFVIGSIKKSSVATLVTSIIISILIPIIIGISSNIRNLVIVSVLIGLLIVGITFGYILIKRDIVNN